eukprot:Em0005g1368a
MVEFVEQQHLRVHVKRGYSSPTDPNWSKQWPWLNTGNNTNSGNIAGRDINVQPAWIQGYTGCNVYVGVVDDGVECTHPDLLKNYIAPLGWNYLDGTSNPFPGETEGERDSHGTGCAGEVGMTKSNSYCGAGVAYNAGIHSNSWGPTDDGMTVQGPGTVLQMAFQNNAASGRGGRGSIYVWAAGNGGQNFDSCAADGYVNSIYTIPIGAASSTGEPAYYDEPCSGKMAVAFVDNPYKLLRVVESSTTKCSAFGLAISCSFAPPAWEIIPLLHFWMICNNAQLMQRPQLGPANPYLGPADPYIGPANPSMFVFSSRMYPYWSHPEGSIPAVFNH